MSTSLLIFKPTGFTFIPMKKKKSKFEKVEPIEYDEEGNPIFNLAADAANDDWIRAARLKKQGKWKELKKLSETKMYRLKEDADNEEERDNPE
ncbi:MAG: hypothetical protein K9I29_06955 [Bacteroidales bacterium]|nr:hypothetical protein [Bacteroidales bacterium]